MSRLPWFKCNPQDLLDGLLDLDTEEQGPYMTVLSLIYIRGDAIPDDARWLAGNCKLSVRRWNVVRASLIVKGKLYLTPDGRLMNARAATELGRSEDYLEINGGKPADKVEAPEPKLNENKALEPLEEERELEKKQEPTVPRPAKPNAARDEWFSKGWDAYPVQGRERSKSRDKTLPIWREAARRAGGGERLVGAIKRYVREDKQHKGECGPPGFHRWLNDGKWEHWLPEARAPSAGSGVSPDLLALHQSLMNGTA